MPITRIKDVDLTSIQDAESINNTVYVPGFMFDNYTPSTAGEVYDRVILDRTPILFTALSDFSKLKFNFEFGTSTEQEEKKERWTRLHRMVYGYLKLGLHVLYECFPEAVGSTNELNCSKLNPTIANNIISLCDRSKYDIRFLTAGVDFINEKSYDSLKAVAEGRTEIDTLTSASAEIIGRGDCCVLVDHTKEQFEGTTEITESLKYAKAVHAQILTFLDYQPESGETGPQGDSSYATSFSPWCEVKIINDEKVIIPGSACGLLAYANSLQNGNNYGLAPAGISRGVIPGLVKPLFDYGTAECEILGKRTSTLDEKGDNEGIAVNPICNVRPYGVVVWGDRTLIYNYGKLKATSFLNIRNMVSQVNKKLYDLSRKYAFEQNTDLLWYNFKADLEPTLDEEVDAGVIAGYKIQKVYTGIKGRLSAIVKIVAIDPVEDFDIEIRLEDSIVSTDVVE